MTRSEIRAAHASALASAVRRINREHEAAGTPEIRALDRYWLDLKHELGLSELAGDLNRGLEAIERYELASLQAITRYVK